MFCDNCGTQLNEGAKFCPRCGTPVTGPDQGQGAYGYQDPNQGQNAYGYQDPNQGQGPYGYQDPNQGQNAYSYQDPNQGQGAYGYQDPNQGQNAYGYQGGAPFGFQTPPAGEAPPKKRGRKKAVIISVVCVLAAALGVGAFFFIRSTFFKSHFSSPESYYESVEQAYLDELGARMERQEANLKQFSGFTASVELTDTGSALAGVDSEMARALADLELSFRQGSTESLWGGQAELVSAGESLITLNLALDKDNSEFYIQLPQLSNDYIFCAAEDLYSMGFSAAVGMVPDIGEGLGSLQLSPFISRYGALLLKYSRDVEREDGSLTVNGIEQKAVCLTVTYNTDQIRGLIRECLETAKTDPQIKEFFTSFGVQISGYGGTGEELYSQFVAYLDQMAAEADNALTDVSAVMKVWVDSDGNVIGRTLDMGHQGEQIRLFSYQTATADGQFAAELVFFEGMEDSVTVTGAGTIENGLADGSFTMMAPMGSTLVFEIQDYDIARNREGYVNGTFIFYAADTELMGVSLTCASDAGTMDVSFGILSNGAELGSVNLSMDAEGYTPELPQGGTAYRVSDNMEMQQYLLNSDMQGFLSALSQNALFKALMENGASFGY